MKLLSLLLITAIHWTKTQSISSSTILVSVKSNLDFATEEALLEEQWQNFKLSYNKIYSPDEEPFRREIFIENRRKIALFDQQYGLGLRSFVQQINGYADMFFHEFNIALNGFRGNQRQKFNYPRASLYIPSANVFVPQHVDWREAGAVTPVKNQGMCASCYAFSAVGALEGQYFRATGKLQELSPQNLVDCTKQFGNDGCDGGLLDACFEYIIINPGVDTLDSYPYEDRNYTCRFRNDTVGAHCTGYGYILSGDEEALKVAVATLGPISAAMDAKDPDFQFYKDGVFSSSICKNGEDDVNHAVLIVGYGTEPDGRKYWLVKNSYGAGWGNGGYFKILRDEDNHCGIATYLRYPLV